MWLPVAIVATGKRLSARMVAGICLRSRAPVRLRLGGVARSWWQGQGEGTLTELGHRTGRRHRPLTEVELGQLEACGPELWPAATRNLQCGIDSRFRS